VRTSIVAAWCGIRGLLAAAIIAILSGSAAAQVCPPPYTPGSSSQTGPICTSQCAPGSYPQLAGGNLSCVPGVAAPTCPEPGDILVTTPNGPVCQQGYAPIAAANNGLACMPGDVRVERPAYYLNGQTLYETCWSGLACPGGYITAEDPDGVMGTTTVCLLPCQDFVLNQGMACSCGSGGQLGAQRPGAPVQQACRPICGPGTMWSASSPLYAFKAEEGSCVSICGVGTFWDGGQCAPITPAYVLPPNCPLGTEPQGNTCVALAPPVCPPAMYWAGQVCFPIGIEDPGPAILIAGCPPDTHWNGGYCVPNLVVIPGCAPGTHWNGLFCVLNGPPLCPPWQHWNGSQCVSNLPQLCPPGQHWNGNACVPNAPPFCPPGQHWNGSKCVPNFVVCPPGQHWNGNACVPNAPPVCPPGQHWNGSACVPNVLPACPPGQHWNGNACVPNAPPACPPGQHWNGSKCVPNGPPACPPGQHWNGSACVPNGPPACPPGQHWNGSKCVPNGPPACPPGQHWNGSACVPNGPPACPPGQHWNGSKCVPNGVPSDIRLKRDIVELQQLGNGLRLYRFRYLWSRRLYVGVMAQEVEAIRPDAVARGEDGYLRVDYSRLGLRLQTWDEWRAAGPH
jgi:hypothetical protein